MSSCRNTRAISSSFQTHIALTTIRVTNAGPDSGMTMLRRMRRVEAPSILAASKISAGSVRKKLDSMYTENGISIPV